MALVVNADPFDPACNSYASVAEVDSYATDRAPDRSAAELWDGLDAEIKSIYVVDATRRLDGLFDWIGDQAYFSQKLGWPRINAIVENFYIDSTEFPEPVVDATCEMALWLAQNNAAISVQQSQAYSALKVGPITIDFNDKLASQTQKYVPDIVPILLDDYGTLQNPDLPGVNSLKVARLYRG